MVVIEVRVYSTLASLGLGFSHKESHKVEALIESGLTLVSFMILVP